MSDVLARITSLADLSGAEARVANYVRRNPRDVPYRSVNEVASAAGVSVASVTRLANRLGYDGFKEFKIRLAEEVSAPVSEIYSAVGAGDTDADVVRKIFGCNIQSLQDTLKMLAAADCTRAARALSRSSRVVFFGIGTSGNAGRDAALRLSHLGVPAEAYGDSYDILVQTARLRRGNVAVGISHSGRSCVTVEALEMAKKNGATTIGIASFRQSPLHDVSDIFFCTSFPQTRVRSAALSAIPAQSCLLDALYVLTARYTRGWSGVERINSLIEARFRTGGKRRQARDSGRN